MLLGPIGHVNCSIQRAGFRISVQMPFIGASADSYVVCDCHGKGVVEVKCPFTERNSSLAELLSNIDFVIDSSYAVRKDHRYSIQMQLQMYVCDVAYCDLVVWQVDSILIFRVYRDDQFTDSFLPQLRDAWVKHIVPELLTRRISSPSVPSVQPVSTSAVATSDVPYDYCICKKNIGGRMIGCDNSDCQYKWFHLECLKMKRVPRKSCWICRCCSKRKK